MMTQTDRDRLVALKKAKNGLITQKEAAAEIGLTERQVRRLLKVLRERGSGCYTGLLKENGIRISMSRSGNPSQGNSFLAVIVFDQTGQAGGPLAR